MTVPRKYPPSGWEYAAADLASLTRSRGFSGDADTFRFFIVQRSAMNRDESRSQIRFPRHVSSFNVSIPRVSTMLAACGIISHLVYSYSAAWLCSRPTMKAEERDGSNYVEFCCNDAASVTIIESLDVNK